MTLRVSKHSNQPCSVIFVNFYNFLNNDVIMSSLVSTGNCELDHDCRRVCSQYRQRRCDKTVSSRRRCVLGIRVDCTDICYATVTKCHADTVRCDRAQEFVGHMTSKGHVIQMNDVIREHVTRTRQHLRTLRSERRQQRRRGVMISQ